MELNRIYNEDCFETFKRIDDKSIDLILTDPPYGKTACQWDVTLNLSSLWAELKRIGKYNCVYVFTASQPFTTDLINSNRKWFKYEWIWDKKLPSGFQIAKYRPMLRHENIVIFSENTPKYFPIKTKQKERTSGGFKKSSLSSPIKNVDGELRRHDDKYPQSIIEFYKRDKGTIHPTQKPVALFEYLIKTYSSESDIVLDPFMGSGTTAITCINLKRNYIGSELNKDYYDIAIKRIEDTLNKKERSL